MIKSNFQTQARQYDVAMLKTETGTLLDIVQNVYNIAHSVSKLSRSRTLVSDQVKFVYLNSNLLFPTNGKIIVSFAN